jgi:RNA polymerase primary sigma factor
MLSRADEEKTARAAAEGSKAAREKLVNANLRFVVNVAKKFKGLGLPLEDLISEGNAGLLLAADRFDVDKGNRFISYAVWWIRQTILSALYQKVRMIRLPSNRVAELVKIEKAKRFVKNQYSTESEIVEIAELLSMDKEHIIDLLNVSQEILSLDNTISKDTDSMLIDFIEDNIYKAPDKDAETRFMEADIENLLDTLNKDEADIIRCRFGLGCHAMSLKEIGNKYNLSKERIRQIETRALASLKNPQQNSVLQAYVA